MTKLFAHKSTVNPRTQTDIFTLILIILSTRNSQLPRYYMTELPHTTPSQQMHNTKPSMLCLIYSSTVSLSGIPTPPPTSNNVIQHSILSTSPPYLMCRVLPNVSVVFLTKMAWKLRWSRLKPLVSSLPHPKILLRSMKRVGWFIRYLVVIVNLC